METRIRIKLSKEEVEQLDGLLQRERDHKIVRRLMCIRLLNSGMKKTKVKDVLGVTFQTIRDWLVVYRDGGLQALACLHYEGRRQSRLLPYKEEIRRYLEENIVTDGKQVTRFINNVLGVKICYEQTLRFIKKNSFSLARNHREFRLRKRRKQFRKNS